jgi:enoyl-CoA hydratase
MSEVATIRIAGGKANAMTMDLLDTIERAIDDFELGPANAAVITGYEKFFSAGLALPKLVDLDRPAMHVFIERFSRTMMRVLACEKPLVAAINGHAIAGGCILAACCDHRIMVDGNGRIGIPELAVGVPFPALPLQIMAARLSDQALRDLVFTGRTVTVDEARTLGLVDEKCPAGMLMDRAMDVAVKLASIPAGAFALTKAAFHAPIIERAQALAALNDRVVEAWLQPHTYDTIRAYLERTVGRK